ncbi:hypothetical protein CORC01_02947 [Colletotrichum orchidophilum]|uniref:Amidohydrolase-related domain-containing protein n=1 Tax=Colletotrichum orchidophilum TaxID=1209926 RepID=A0A1G4BKC3_9PEZI|nr:uncharacterized protein CORC01_02947 [Colletotrichum orchidophilum]OHF01756.1 hypothetical protein CORC01_02947 [Colletotrichum orchidophilum]
MRTSALVGALEAIDSHLTSDLNARGDMRYMLTRHEYIHCTNLTNHEMSLIIETGDKMRVSFKSDFGVRDALIWGTQKGAEAVGLADKIGTLTPGKRTDFFVFAGKRTLSGYVSPLGPAILHSTPLVLI